MTIIVVLNIIIEHLLISLFFIVLIILPKKSFSKTTNKIKKLIKRLSKDFFNN